METLIAEPEIRQAVALLGKQIATEFRDEDVTVLGVLTGSIIFLADLVRSIDLPHRIGLIQASSYRGATTSPLELRINDSLLPDIRGRSVVLIDDIFDTGATLSALISTVQAYEPRRVRSNRRWSIGLEGRRRNPLRRPIVDLPLG